MHALPKMRADFCDFNHYVGYRIAKICGLCGTPQRDLAKAMRLSVISIGAYERGDTMPLFDNAYEIANALHTDVNDLCGFGSRSPCRALRRRAFSCCFPRPSSGLCRRVRLLRGPLERRQAMPVLFAGIALFVVGFFISQPLGAAGLAVFCFRAGWELCDGHEGGR